VLGIVAVGWDASRPVPWARLIKEWLIYGGIMVVALALLVRDRGLLPLIAGVLVSGPIFVLLGAVMAKFGYQRKSLADLRTPRAAPTPTPANAAVARPRPAPTRRTSTGPNHPRRKR
jgi:hypothetical protein